MAAPAHESVTSASVSGDPEVTCNKPSGTGTVLKAHLFIENNRTITPPSGWALIRADVGSFGGKRATYWKADSGSEPATYTFSWGANDRCSIAIERISGADETDPIDVHGGASSLTAPSITTTVADCFLVAGVSNHDQATFTPPAGYTERWDLGTGGGIASNSGATKEQAAAGASGSAVFAGGSSGPVAQHIAIAPAPAPKGGSSRTMMGVG